MKLTSKIAAAVFAALGLGLASGAAQAHPESCGGGMGPGMMGGMMYRMHGGMGPGAMGQGPMGHGAMGPGMGGYRGGPAAGQQFMTPEEQTAMREKMRAAATPEERQKVAEANHAEMQKRAKEKGVTLPETPGPGRGMGPNAGMNRPCAPVQ